MSENKIEKQLLKLRPKATGPLLFTPVLLSDSKGNHIRKHVQSGIDFDIQWWCKGGSQINDSFDWLKRNLSHKLKRHNKIALYVWLGTCDLTVKNKQFTSLRADDFATVDYIERKLNEIVSFLRRFSGVKLTILEVPVYSIVEWNRSKGHKDPNSFSDQDVKLQSQVQELNNRIRNINDHLKSRSPRFTLDILRSKRNNKGKTKKSVFNFKLYSDGIHPGALLGKLWFRQISSLMINDCVSH
ncbi:hypothetical protein FSP39_024764 [Pinctada imbricata]|uniref:Uncharacterized protein n=1 Tax=Pinctada imbricata TaxID=66713 RepID=A0AA88XPL7_PINIB|nr:hypothetical protein FSP39_024764 [Pinctada imbricata]